MSTHAIVGIATDSGYKGRYVHFDGYTEAMMPALKRCIKNSVIADANPIAYILGNHWSSFSVANHEAADTDTHNEVWYTESTGIFASYLYLIDQVTFEITAYINIDDNWVAIDTTKAVIKTKVNA
jgi:hypothetical protein